MTNVYISIAVGAVIGITSAILRDKNHNPMPAHRLSKRTLSLLSLLVLVGFALIPVTVHTLFIYPVYAVILTGAIAFGTLLRKQDKNN